MSQTEQETLVEELHRELASKGFNKFKRNHCDKPYWDKLNIMITIGMDIEVAIQKGFSICANKLHIYKADDNNCNFCKVPMILLTKDNTRGYNRYLNVFLKEQMKDIDVWSGNIYAIGIDD